MSIDTEAMQRVIVNLSSMVSRAKKAAMIEREKRAERIQCLMGEYTSVEDVNDAYGYADITDAERVELLAYIDRQLSPTKQDISVEEIYLLELQAVLSQAKKRLRDLVWEDLSVEEKIRIEQQTAAYRAKRQQARRLVMQKDDLELALGKRCSI